MNSMSLVESFVAEMRKKTTDVTIDYFSIDTENVFKGIPATLGRTMFKSSNDYGVSIITHGKDFIIETKDIPIKPQRGDYIHYKGKRYEVLAPNDEPVWRFSGVNEESIRIHTKEVGEVDNE